MPVKVCDALCGSGKTTACIKMMNECSDSKFVFVTQFLSEVERIKNSCASRDFYSPEGDMDSGRTKLGDIHTLLKEGRNIATTHALLVNCTDEIKQLIRDQNYVLILDESVDVLCVSDIAQCDINILLKSNAIKEEDGVIEWIYGSEYGEMEENARFKEEAVQAKSKNFLKFGDNYFFWSIPPELFTCFKDAYVLTYLFQAQTLRCFFDLYNIEYEYIGVKQTGERQYEFCDLSEMDRRRELRDKIHILDRHKLNEIGSGRTDLSYSWYERRRGKKDDGGIEQLKKNLVNVFRNVYSVPAKDIMWTTFKGFKNAVSYKGLSSSFLVYNKRASNEYAHKHYLGYCVNNFPRPWEMRYFIDHGVKVDGDTYALSILIQWMFRSAIRNGEDIWIYVPSVRMRTLLKKWLDNLAEGKDLEPVQYSAIPGFERKQLRPKSKKGGRRK